MTDKLRQAAQQALEAYSLRDYEFGKYMEALRAALAEQPAEPQDPVAYNGWVLREVLFDNGEPVGHREPTKAEPQEPVAWCHLQYNEDGTYFADCLQHYPDSYGNTPLYAAPQPAKPAEQRVPIDLDALGIPHGQQFQPAEQERDGAMNALCKMFHHGEEVESDDGMAMLVPLDLWHDAIDALDSLTGEDEAAPEAPQPAKREPLTEEELRDALRSCPHDTVENLRVRWLYAKDFARAIERAHGITGETK